MEIKIPIMGRDETVKEILKRISMPSEGWIDINNGINAKFDTPVLAGAVMAILKKFRETDKVKDIEVLTTAEASGNVLVILGVPIAHYLGLAKEGLYAHTFRKTEVTEIPMFDLFGSVRSASHKDMVKVLSTRRDFVARQRVLMIDDVLRDGGTAEAIKKMIENVKGEFLGLGVIFRKMWLATEQKEKLGDTPIVSLIDVASPYPKDFEKFKRIRVQED